MKPLKLAMYLFSVIMIFCAVMDLVVWFKGGYLVPSWAISVLSVGLSIMGLVIIKEVDLTID